MPTEFTLACGQLAPKNKGGPRAGIGCKAVVRRTGDGDVTIQIYRGDGGGPETFPTEIRSKTYPAESGRPLTVQLATIDLGLVDFTPRAYQMRITASGADITITEALIAPEPYAPAGTS
jgi:hypothetical protein